jgi:hypothetical protein
MAHTLRDRWQCDRCAATVTDRRAADRLPYVPGDWGRLVVRTPPLDPSGVERGDLCPACLADLDAWLATKPQRA